MTNALERATRAMYDNIQPDWDWNDPDAELLRQMYRDNARIVLTTIREPGLTIDAGALTCWQATIDAILAQA